MSDEQTRVMQEKLESRAKHISELASERDALRKTIKELKQDEAQYIYLLAKLTIGRTAFTELPPEELRLHVGTRTTAGNYWLQGFKSSQKVLEIFGDDPEGAVLDWGCGCGRTYNWLGMLPSWKQAYWGCDVDQEAIAWLHSRAIENVASCSPSPPLPFPAECFSGIFSFSVLTHIPPNQHRDWYVELHRVLKPGGRAFLTTNGEVAYASPRLPDNLRKQYDDQGYAFSDIEGHYKGIAIASPDYTKSQLADLFSIESYKAPGYAAMDGFVVRKI